MKLKHLWKAAGLVALSAILILTLCLAGLLALVLRSAQITQFWNAPLTKLSQSLVLEEGHYHFTGEDLLAQQDLWLMLVGRDGQVLWQYNKPAEVPDQYDLLDVAAFTRWYLEDYPVQTRIRPDGLLVAGAPKGSTWKLTISLSEQILHLLPVWGVLLFFLSLICVLALAALLLRRWFRQDQQARDEARSDWINGISHDIRTPLTGIVGATNVLLEQENTLTPEQRHELIRNANEEAQWLIRIVENLLSITRMGGDEAKVNKTPEAAEEIIEGAVGKFTRRWGTDIPVEVRLPEEFLLVPMDPLLMEQVLTNLMENAVLHGKTTRHITVTLCRSGDWARFIVEDDGQGIAPDRLEHLFDGTLQGQQGDRGRSMGIGLSVCRTVVRAHGGHIRGENRQEGGARFTVELPLDKEIQQEVDSYEDQG